MKFEVTTAFEGDWRRLSESERAPFRAVVREDFHPACERRRDDPVAPWPKIRVKAVEGASGIWEMTWSFSGPDGRATFEWVRLTDVPAIRWRRIGGHSIFGEP